MSDLQSPTLQASQADVWYLKIVNFRGAQFKIITQNFNGPCSFIAICNILILRKNILIEPLTRTTVSYEFLSQLVAEFLIKHSPNVDISDALSIMPHTQKGLDLNPLFTSSTSFLAATETAGGELKLFSQAGIDLVHGWLVDPESPEAIAMLEEDTEDYDSAVALIAEADHIAGGLLVPMEEHHDASNSSTGRPQEEWTDTESRKIRNALAIRHFLEQTQSQLTYHGLFHLASTLPAGSLVALFRSSHLSVLYKSDAPSADGWQVLDDTPAPIMPQPQAATEPTTDALLPAESNVAVDPPVPASLSTVTQGMATLTVTPPADHSSAAVTPPPIDSSQASERATPQPPAASPPVSPPHPNPSPPPTAQPQPAEHDSALYTLATDHVFLHEPSVVWERIEDVDGSAGVFVDSVFVRATPVGGDWAGRTVEHTASDIQRAQEEAQRVAESGVGLTDHQLARQLQAEEEQMAMQEQEAYMQDQQRTTREEEERRQKELHSRREKESKKRGKSGGKKDCLIM